MWSAARSAKISMILCMPERVSGGDAKFQGFCHRWNKWEGQVVLRLCVTSRCNFCRGQLGVEIFRLEQWREKAIGGIDASLKQRKGDPVQAELDSAMKRIGELTMQVELLEAKTETFGPLGRRRSRR